ncbi:iron response transcriptional regulator IrrA [Bauldia sp.]|uniref:iron response transcriptional regulator IrrA n=1 Tax=Bauldia sp. TaxID=2575872 RepID=UPI003BA8BC46
MNRAELGGQTLAEPAFSAKKLLQEAGLRPTHQRVYIADILFSTGDRHLSAEEILFEIKNRGLSVSLATIYNNLNSFTEAGILREILTDGSRKYYDTNTSNHHHFFIEESFEIIDIPADDLGVNSEPEPPPGYEVTGVDVVVRLRRIRD